MSNKIIVLTFFLLVCAEINKAFIYNFSADVYKELLANKQERFIVSPLLANVALALISLGAKNNTGEEMRTTLDLPDSVDKVKTVFDDFFQLFQNNDLYLKVANIIYVSKTFPVSENFRQTARDIFGGQVKNSYFHQNYDASLMLNEGIEKQTHFKIPHFFPRHFLHSNTTALLANAIYFEVPWQFPFSQYIRSKGKFHINDSYSVDIENLINLPSGNKFNYCLNKKLDAQILELPFKANNASMVFVLPKKKNGLYQLEDQMDEVLKDHDFEFTNVQIELPIFWMETPLIDYKNVFQNSKIGNIFVPGQADLSGIAGKPKEIYFNSLLQKIVFDINSKGVGNAENVFNYTEDVFFIGYKHKFIADHPFLFYVKVQDLILFAGKYMGPTDRETNVLRQFKRIVRPKEKHIFLRV